MSRSFKKGPYIDHKLLRKVLKQKQDGSEEPIKTWARSSMIPPDFIGHIFAVHNGKAFINVHVTEDMIGHRLGEFALTRTFKTHAKK